MEILVHIEKVAGVLKSNCRGIYYMYIKSLIVYIYYIHYLTMKELLKGDGHGSPGNSTTLV